ncbi:CocE/NonD family hydrolase [Rhodococcus sp. AW25M09]|uniref:CocE/NonD family hydrolase n=1 Tax=Rhodococcus sp. AW25M09 TaxID=1268303 RepID=UPI000348E75B|nr:CocE/NonD family hydrolase [Rhodococcus sp. AW25M09]
MTPHDSTDHEGYRLPDAPVAPENDHGVDDDALGRHLAKYVAPAADFFDVFVRETRPASSLSRVQWHLGHGDDPLEFRTSDSWPPAGVEVRELVISDGGRATSGAMGGRLTPDLQAESTATWVHDPDDLVPVSVINPFASLLEYPDESGLHSRPDVLTFTSEVGSADLDLVGPIDVTLTVGSTAPTTDLIVKVLDVDPGGAARVVAWGDGQIDTADGDVEATIELGHVAYRLEAGHALRLQIASSEFPAFQPHPGTGEPAWSAVETRPSTQTLRCSDRSVVRLSVLPTGVAW